MDKMNLHSPQQSKSPINMILSHHSKKNNKYRSSSIADFIDLQIFETPFLNSKKSLNRDIQEN